MSTSAHAPLVVREVMPGDPPFRIVELNGIPVGKAHDMVDVVRIAHRVGMKHVDLDDPAVVEWIGGDKYTWSR